MAEKRELYGQTTKNSNLPEYHQTKHRLFNDLSDENRLQFEEKAKAHNIALREKPDASHISE